MRGPEKKYMKRGKTDIYIDIATLLNNQPNARFFENIAPADRAIRIINVFNIALPGRTIL